MISKLLNPAEVDLEALKSAEVNLELLELTQKRWNLP